MQVQFSIFIFQELYNSSFYTLNNSYDKVKFYPPINRKLKFSFTHLLYQFLSFLIILIAFSSCLEEQTKLVPEIENPNQIAKVKDWFEANKHQLRIPDGGISFMTESKELILPFFEKEPDWDKFHHYTFPDGREVYEINLANAEKYFPKYLKDSLNLSDPSKGVIQNIMFVESLETGGFSPLISSYYPNNDSSIKEFGEIYYNKIPLDWSGLVDIWTYDERFFIGFRIINGEIIGVINQAGETGIDAKKKNPLGANFDITCKYYQVTYLAYTVSAGGVTTEHYETGIVMECSGGSIAHQDTPVIYDYSPPTGIGDYGGVGGTTSNTGIINYIPPPIPAPVIKISVDETFRKNMKAICLLNKLRENEYFERMAQQFEGVYPDINLTLFLNDLPPSINGQAQWMGDGKNIHITINQMRLTDRSSLEVARTLLHEMIHADFYRAVKTKYPSYNDLMFQNTFNQYVIRYQGSADQHHNLMAERYIDVMAGILEEIHKKLDYNAFALAMKNVYPNGIPKSFYKSLAWEGLTGTTAFKLMEKITVHPPLRSPNDLRNEAKLLLETYGSKECNLEIKRD